MKRDELIRAIHFQDAVIYGGDLWKIAISNEEGQTLCTVDNGGNINEFVYI